MFYKKSTSPLLLTVNSKQPSRLHLVTILLIALGYGLVLAGLPLEVFKDRANYLIYADQSLLIFLGHWSQGVLTGLANEPIWLLINAGLNLIFEPETTLRIIIGVPASIVAYLVLRTDSKNFIWLLLFLLLPQILKNHIVHLRQGVAISIFLLGWFSNSRSLSWFLLLLTPFIHASFFFILALLALTTIASKLRLAADLRNILFVVFGLATGVSLAGLAQYLGARQALEYDFTTAQISGLGFIFWTMVLVILISQGRSFMRQHAFAIGSLVFYLSTYFFIEVTARIFESSLAILLLAGLQMSGWRRITFISMIMSYGVLGYALRLDQPWLGFGFA